MSNANKSTREKAAAARAKAESAERRRENTVRIVIAAVVVVIVAGIIGAALWTVNSKKDKASPSASPSATGPLPTGVSGPAYGTAVGTAEKPVLDVYEDFQCPACAATEKALGATFDQLVAEGKVKLVYHPMNFIDQKVQNDSSTRASAAFGCAVDAGVTQKYHDIVYANQPAQEGIGYTQEQLKSFGVQAGITGAALDTFNTCVDQQKYAAWPVLANEAAFARGVSATPTFYLNDQKLSTADYSTPEALTAKIQAASQ